MTTLLILCSCGGEQNVRIDDLKANPSQSVLCGHSQTINGEVIKCTIRYQVIELLKVVDRQMDTFDARMKPPSLGFKG